MYFRHQEEKNSMIRQLMRSVKVWRWYIILRLQSVIYSLIKFLCLRGIFFSKESWKLKRNQIKISVPLKKIVIKFCVALKWTKDISNSIIRDRMNWVLVGAVRGKADLCFLFKWWQNNMISVWIHLAGSPVSTLSHSSFLVPLGMSLILVT